MKELRTRFEEKYHVDSDGCWIWDASTNGKGYAQMKWEGRNRPATHVALFLATGERVPPGHEPDHRCFNTLCVNPDHLEVVTHAVNMERRRRKSGWIRRPDPTKCAAGLHDWVPENMTKSKRPGCRPCKNARQRERRQSQ